ncbi:MAG: NAD(P)-binding domain-containing protein [Bacteriovoracaceae bacterium]
MKLGFIGIGQVGGALALKLGKGGHSIILGARDTTHPKAQALAKEIGLKAKIENIRDCIEQSDVIFLATPWKAVEGLALEYRDLLANKVLIDCTNPLKPDLSGLAVSGENSGGEILQSLLPQTKVIKAFNTVGFNIMKEPVLEGRKSVMYFCGNDEKSRHLVQELINEVGFFPIEAGDIKSSRLLEPFALLWISSAYKYGLGREFAFSLIKRG